MGGGSGSKASFTPFVDPRVYGTSPTDDDDNISATGTFPLWLVVGNPQKGVTKQEEQHSAAQNYVYFFYFLYKIIEVKMIQVGKIIQAPCRGGGVMSWNTYILKTLRFWLNQLIYCTLVRNYCLD